MGNGKIPSKEIKYKKRYTKLLKELFFKIPHRTINETSIEQLTKAIKTQKETGNYNDLIDVLIDIFVVNGLNKLSTSKRMNLIYKGFTYLHITFNLVNAIRYNNLDIYVFDIEFNCMFTEKISNIKNTFPKEFKKIETYYHEGRFWDTNKGEKLPFPHYLYYKYHDFARHIFSYKIDNLLFDFFMEKRLRIKTTNMREKIRETIEYSIFKAFEYDFLNQRSIFYKRKYDTEIFDLAMLVYSAKQEHKYTYENALWDVIRPHPKYKQIKKDSLEFYNMNHYFRIYRSRKYKNKSL